MTGPPASSPVQTSLQRLMGWTAMAAVVLGVGRVVVPVWSVNFGLLVALPTILYGLTCWKVVIPLARWVNPRLVDRGPGQTWFSVGFSHLFFWFFAFDLAFFAFSFVYYPTLLCVLSLRLW